MLHTPRQAGREQYHNPQHIHEAEPPDRRVPPQVLVRHHRAQDGRDVAPRLERVTERSGARLAQPQGTGEPVGVVGAVGHVVLQRPGEAVVREALAQLDDGDEKGAVWQFVCHPREEEEVLGGGRRADVDSWCGIGDVSMVTCWLGGGCCCGGFWAGRIALSE